MDEKKRIALISSIKEQGWPPKDGPCPIVSLEAFFEGNDDLGSIGCNLIPHPGIPFMYDVLKKIRAKSNVQAVLVEIMEINEEEKSEWPFSERVFILSSAAKKDVEEWLSPLHVDSVGEGYSLGKPMKAPSLEPGVTVYAAWWD